MEFLALVFGDDFLADVFGQGGEDVCIEAVGVGLLLRGEDWTTVVSGVGRTSGILPTHGFARGIQAGDEVCLRECFAIFADGCGLGGGGEHGGFGRTASTALDGRDDFLGGYADDSVLSG